MSTKTEPTKPTANQAINPAPQAGRHVQAHSQGAATPSPRWRPTRSSPSPASQAAKAAPGPRSRCAATSPPTISPPSSSPPCARSSPPTCPTSATPPPSRSCSSCSRSVTSSTSPTTACARSSVPASSTPSKPGATSSPPSSVPAELRRAWVWPSNTYQPKLYPIAEDGTIRIYAAPEPDERRNRRRIGPADPQRVDAPRLSFVLLTRHQSNQTKGIHP